mmetsp:Transcript_4399/g.8477  ORF Transcript_4399/g.8477 Transcript_4399/m.8477 type:complete len:346 (+) Transcript_4399:1213-2250(+)
MLSTRGWHGVQHGPFVERGIGRRGDERARSAFAAFLGSRRDQRGRVSRRQQQRLPRGRGGRRRVRRAGCPIRLRRRRRRCLQQQQHHSLANDHRCQRDVRLRGPAGFVRGEVQFVRGVSRERRLGRSDGRGRDAARGAGCRERSRSGDGEHVVRGVPGGRRGVFAGCGHVPSIVVGIVGGGGRGREQQRRCIRFLAIAHIEANAGSKGGRDAVLRRSVSHTRHVSQRGRALREGDRVLQPEQRLGVELSSSRGGGRHRFQSHRCFAHAPELRLGTYGRTHASNFAVQPSINFWQCRSTLRCYIICAHLQRGWICGDDNDKFGGGRSAKYRDFLPLRPQKRKWCSA